jgi:hypothetical protein
MIQATRAFDLKASIVDALEDHRYDWRTIDGLARTLDITKPEILAVLRGMSDELVSATDDGRILFTTRNHYEKPHGFRDKLPLLQIRWLHSTNCKFLVLLLSIFYLDAQAVAA